MCSCRCPLGVPDCCLSLLEGELDGIGLRVVEVYGVVYKRRIWVSIDIER